LVAKSTARSESGDPSTGIEIFDGAMDWPLLFACAASAHNTILPLTRINALFL
jgi:hypothetical protein